MAIPGIIEDSRGWVSVADPTHPAPPKPGFFQRLTGRGPAPVRPPQVDATDFITDEVSSFATRFVVATKTVLTSATSTNGLLGPTATLNEQVVHHAYVCLDKMRDVDRMLAQLDDLEESAHTRRGELLDSISAKAAEAIEQEVIAPTLQMENLAEEVKVRDMQQQLPGLTPPASGNGSLDSLTARLQALNDLDHTTL